MLLRKLVNFLQRIFIREKIVEPSIEVRRQRYQDRLDKIIRAEQTLRR